MTGTRTNRLLKLVRHNPLEFCLASIIVLVTVVAFLPGVPNDFVHYDDADYVTANPAVQGGFTPSGIRWAFRAVHAATWQPVTWVSHMVDWELYGGWAPGHHLTSLLIHVLSSVLLFVFLERLTGKPFRSALVALLFAVHPLRLESVAWVASRKDVLSTLFLMVTILAYAAWTRGRNPKSYLIALLAFAAGLMSKPMLVTVPALLLLLDYWPLKRVSGAVFEGVASRQTVGSLVLEKAPFAFLSAGSMYAAYMAQKSGAALASSAQLPLALRLDNAAVSFFAYVWKTLWPANLAVFYPHPTDTLPTAPPPNPLRNGGG